MKKIFASALAIAAMATLSVAASAADFSASSALNNTITVDAVKDAAYVSEGIVVDVPEDNAEGTTTGLVYTAWDESNLYVYFEVTDSAVSPAEDVTSQWMNDSVEIYLNLADTDGPIADINAAQYTVGPSFDMFAGGGWHLLDNEENAKFAYAYTDYGYVVEVSIPWGAEYTAKEGAIVPVAFGINDDTDGDASTREYHCFSGQGQSGLWNAADASYDLLCLTAEEYVAPPEFFASSALNNAVKIDAEKDAAYVSEGIVVNVPEDATEGTTTGLVYTAWDEKNMYVYFEVTDSAVSPAEDVTSQWMNDSVEIYLNLSGTDGPIADINAAQYTVGPSFDMFAGGGWHLLDNEENADFAYKYTDFGYVVEVSIPWGAEYTAKEGAIVPVAFGINDDTDGDASTREYHCYAGQGQSGLWNAADGSYNLMALTAEEYVEAPVVEEVVETPVEEVVETPAAEEVAVEEVVETPAAEEAEEAPQTFDFGVIAAIAAIVSAAGYAVSKKR